jgi:hypothetical protein
LPDQALEHHPDQLPMAAQHGLAGRRVQQQSQQRCDDEVNQA